MEWNCTLLFECDKSLISKFIDLLEAHSKVCMEIRKIVFIMYTFIVLYRTFKMISLSFFLQFVSK